MHLRPMSNIHPKILILLSNIGISVAWKQIRIKADVHHARSIIEFF